MSSQQRTITASDEEFVADLGTSLSAQLAEIKTQWPQFYECIDVARLSNETFYFVTEMASETIDFHSTHKGGRGDLYREAQRNPLIRGVGIRQLFELVSPQRELSSLRPQHKILDVLGGDGVLARAIPDLVTPARAPHVLTSDLSEDMVAAARAYGLFALRQPAQNLLLKDESIDGVIIAYGAHHIPQEQRVLACREAYRVLKDDGRIVLHDFEEDSPVAGWFGEVVDKYSITGHQFPHFTIEEIHTCLQEAGFSDIEVTYLYDPFILDAPTREDAIRTFAECLLNMYGLVKLLEHNSEEEALDIIAALSDKYFRYDYQSLGLSELFGAPEIQVAEVNGAWHLEAPRVALVGHATKRRL